MPQLRIREAEEAEAALDGHARCLPHAPASSSAEKRLPLLHTSFFSVAADNELAGGNLAFTLPSGQTVGYGCKVSIFWFKKKPLFFRFCIGQI